MTSTVPTYDPRTPGFIADPYSHYARLRAENPVHRTRFGFVLLTRHSDLRAAYDSPTLSRNTRLWDGFSGWRRGSEDGPLEQMMQSWLVMIDPPRHTPLRAIHEAAFSRDRVGSAQAGVEKIVGDLLDDAVRAGGMDAVADFADRIPVYVINQLLGMPRQDWDQFVGWSRAIAQTSEAFLTRAVLAEGKQALQAMHDYFRPLVQARRRDPGDDLLTALVTAESDGVRLTDDLLLDSLIFLYQAGHPTGGQLLALALHSLLRHPDQLERLRADPSLLPGAVEELQRFDGPVQMNDRVAVTDQEFAGLELRAGELVRLCIAAANRDPERYPDPDTLDLGRTAAGQLGYGRGLHYCIGEQLGRIQTRVAIEGLLDRAPGLRLADEEVTFLPSVSNRGVARMMVRF
jgi:cytochrome P450